MKGALLKDWQGKIGILIIPPEFYVQISSEIPLEVVTDWDMVGMLVSANKPYLTVKDNLRFSGILDKLIFVDAASKFSGANPCGEKIVLIDNPANLTELTISIMKNIKNLGKKKFLIFDSLTTLLIYTRLEELTKFAHSLGLMMKTNKVTCLFLVVDQEATKEMLSFLSTIADKYVHLNLNKEGEVIIV